MQYWRRWGNHLIPAPARYLLVPVCSKWCLPKPFIVQWHPAWVSLYFAWESFWPKGRANSLLEICSCKMSSDLSFVLPSSACSSQCRPMFPPVFLALLGSMLPLSPLGWVWLMSFYCSGTQNSLRLPKHLSAEIDLLCKLYILSTGIAPSRVRLRVPLSRNHQCLYCHQFIFLFSPSLSPSPENHAFWVGGGKVLGTAFATVISPKSFVSASSAVFPLRT